MQVSLDLFICVLAESIVYQAIISNILTALPQLSNC